MFAKAGEVNTVFAKMQKRLRMTFAAQGDEKEQARMQNGYRATADSNVRSCHCNTMLRSQAGIEEHHTAGTFVAAMTMSRHNSKNEQQCSPYHHNPLSCVCVLCLRITSYGTICQTMTPKQGCGLF